MRFAYSLVLSALLFRDLSEHQTSYNMSAFAAKLNQAGHLDAAKSCKELVQDKQYTVLKLGKFESKFGGEKLIATISDGQEKCRVFLPSRISADDFSEEELVKYNSSEPSLYLVFRGMLGRAINVDFVAM